MKIVNLTSDKGLTLYSLYETIIPIDNDEMVTILNDNDERHELLVNEYCELKNISHLKEIAFQQMETDISNNYFKDLLKYTFTKRVTL